MARDTEFVQRQSPLMGMDFLLLCIFSHQQDSQISLEGLSNELFKRGSSIAKQSLQDRFNKYSLEFMKKVLKRALSQKLFIKIDNLNKVDCLFKNWCKYKTLSGISRSGLNPTFNIPT